MIMTPVTAPEIIEAARAVTGEEIPARVIERRPGDPPELRADSQKIRRALGWNPEYSDLTDILETAWRWHRTPRY